MKNYLIYAWVLLIVFSVSCNKILDRPPLDRITEQQMTFSATEMRLYSNQFYPDFPGWNLGDFTGGIFWNDQPSDNMVHGNYNANAQVSGTITVPTNADNANWNWSKVRAVNYFLANYQISTEAPAVINTFVGEMYFWRAWYYYDMLKKYGDLPWFSRPLTAADEEQLYGPRLKRNIVVDSILNDLDRAISLLAAPGVAELLRINKGAALAFKSRVALYEGSWEKYHEGTPFGVSGSDPSKYFRASADAAEELMAANYYQIPGFEPNRNYWRIFNQKDLSANTEIILWSKFDKALGLTHAGQNMLPWEGSNTGVSKQLIDYYLAADGQPIALSPLYLGDDSIAQEVANRDPRLAQTIFVRGHPRRYVGADTIKFSEPDINKLPNLRSTTGYMIFKGSAPDDADRTGAVTANIVFRYAEVLLNYAEAKAELGEITQDVLDATINKLRDRVQMPHLTTAVGFVDPQWDFPTLSPLLNEIRRERRIELALEGFRFDDIMRWRAHHLLKRPLYGAKYSQFEDKEFDPPLNNIPVNEDGYIFPYLNSPAVNGWQFDPAKHYLLPIPTNELVLNPDLQQNPNY